MWVTYLREGESVDLSGPIIGSVELRTVMEGDGGYAVINISMPPYGTITVQLATKRYIVIMGMKIVVQKIRKTGRVVTLAFDALDDVKFTPNKDR